MYILVYSFLFHQIYNLPIILEINKNNLLTVPNFIDLYTRENKISEHRGIVNKEASVKRENRYFFFQYRSIDDPGEEKNIFDIDEGRGSGAFVILVGEKIGQTNYETEGKKKKKVNVRSIVRERRR